MIAGVSIKKIIKHSDERGFFAEIVKFGDESFHKILQTSYSETRPGVIKAFHIHDYWEIWSIVKGQAKVVLFDMRPNSPTKEETQIIYTGEDNMMVIAIPGNVAHGYKAIGRKSLGIVYHASQTYNPKITTIREIPFDDPTINFDWTKP